MWEDCISIGKLHAGDQLYIECMNFEKVCPLGQMQDILFKIPAELQNKGFSMNVKNPNVPTNLHIAFKFMSAHVTTCVKRSGSIDDTNI